MRSQATLAQLVEHRIRNAKVNSSSLLCGSQGRPKWAAFFASHTGLNFQNFLLLGGLFGAAEAVDGGGDDAAGGAGAFTAGIEAGDGDVGKGFRVSGDTDWR